MRDQKIARFRTRAAEDPTLDAQATRLGHLVRALGQGRVAVKIPGIAEPLSARIALPLTPTRLNAAIHARQEAVVVFEGRSLKRPIVIGLIETDLTQAELPPPPSSREIPQPTDRTNNQPTADPAFGGSAGPPTLNAIGTSTAQPTPNAIGTSAAQPTPNAIGTTAGGSTLNATDTSDGQPTLNATDTSAPQPTVDALIDGKRVKIVGADEIVLECGSASITLRRNGKVIIRGAYVETHSQGTNRIKGAAVRIN